VTKQDTGIGIILLIVSFYIFYYTATADFFEFEEDPGPTLFPLIVGIGLAICSIGLIFWPKTKSDKKEESFQKSENGVIKGIVAAISILIYAFLFKIIVFIYSSLIFLVFFVFYMSKKKNKKLIFTSVITSVIVTFFIFYIFNNYLDIYLP